MCVCVGVYRRRLRKGEEVKTRKRMELTRSVLAYLYAFIHSPACGSVAEMTEKRRRGGNKAENGVDLECPCLFIRIYIFTSDVCAPRMAEKLRKRLKKK